MFCDLSARRRSRRGSIPRTCARSLRAYQTCCRRDRRDGFGGFVAKYMGDGVLVYFGYPQAHEHDAERAVRAGLAAGRGGAEAQDRAGSPCKSVSASPPGWSSSAT